MPPRLETRWDRARPWVELISKRAGSLAGPRSARIESPRLTRRRFVSLLTLVSLPTVSRAGLAQDGDGFGSIHVLARKGDIAGVRKLLKENPKLIEFAQQGQGTPLAAAARAGQVEMIRYLIE